MSQLVFTSANHHFEKYLFDFFYKIVYGYDVSLLAFEAAAVTAWLILAVLRILSMTIILCLQI